MITKFDTDKLKEYYNGYINDLTKPVDIPEGLRQFFRYEGDFCLSIKEFAYNCGCVELSAGANIDRAEYITKQSKLPTSLVLMLMMAREFRDNYGTAIFTTIQTQSREDKVLNEILAIVGGYTPIGLYQNPKHPDSRSKMWIFNVADIVKYFDKLNIDVSELF